MFSMFSLSLSSFIILFTLRFKATCSKYLDVYLVFILEVVVQCLSFLFLQNNRNHYIKVVYKTCTYSTFHTRMIQCLSSTSSISYYNGYNHSDGALRKLFSSVAFRQSFKPWKYHYYKCLLWSTWKSDKTKLNVLEHEKWGHFLNFATFR